MDLEVVIGVLAVVGVLAGLGLAAGRRGSGRQRKQAGYLVVAVMELVFVWAAVLMWRHVFADGTHLYEAVVTTVLAIAGAFAIAFDAVQALRRTRGTDGSTPAPTERTDRARDLARH